MPPPPSTIPALRPVELPERALSPDPLDRPFPAPQRSTPGKPRRGWRFWRR
ncbi:hypothetical protein [Pseudonocardia sp. TRM90224]|uniref:hypothetical protein n=1 Tax=Pseudonocardia sp. TRM90224 TaxID=2812678 RepID=UPI001E350D6E|nr:hypothetical protein [Pseudonocardia sp. TRM90224]